MKSQQIPQRYKLKIRNFITHLKQTTIVPTTILLAIVVGIFLTSCTNLPSPFSTSPHSKLPASPPPPDGFILPQTTPLPTLPNYLPPNNLATTAALNAQKFGHFRYLENNPQQMIFIASYAQGEYQRFESLAPEAGLALMKLIYAARDDGVWLVPVSGFRPIAAQEKLFQLACSKA